MKQWHTTYEQPADDFDALTDEQRGALGCLFSALGYTLTVADRPGTEEGDVRIVYHIAPTKELMKLARAGKEPPNARTIPL